MALTAVDLRDADLRDSIRADQLSVVYQPQVDLQSGWIVGFEALLRWRHPSLGSVSPALFIERAEKIGFINEMSEWVLAQACQEAAGWPSDISLSVNVSPVHLMTADVRPLVTETLVRTGLDRSRLELEITESVYLPSTDSNLEVLADLSGSGVGLVLDDFGAGYSSFGYLRDFPIKKIKIDRSYIIRLHEPQVALMVQFIIDMARSLGVKTLAEGIETQEQLEALQVMGCHQGQGYLFSRPVDSETAAKLIDVCRVDDGVARDDVGEE